MLPSAYLARSALYIQVGPGTELAVCTCNKMQHELKCARRVSQEVAKHERATGAGMVVACCAVFAAGQFKIEKRSREK